MKQLKKIKVLTMMIVVFIVFYLSLNPINNLINKKNEEKINNTVLYKINDSLSNIMFNVKSEEGNYYVEFKDVEHISDFKEILKNRISEVKVRYVFRHTKSQTESEEFYINIPVLVNSHNRNFSIEGYDETKHMEIIRKILEQFLEFKFEEFYCDLKKEDSLEVKEIVSQVIYDDSNMNYDEVGNIIEGSSVVFNAKKSNSLGGMIFSGDLNWELKQKKDVINVEIKEYTGELIPLWSVDYKNVEEIKVFENGKSELKIIDKEMIQRIFSLINEFKYEQVNTLEMQNIIKDKHYTLVFNDGIFEYYVVSGAKGIGIVNNQSAAGEEASQDLEFFLKMEM
ncbi:hypothetical protein [Oceanirhabdus sp. W0125-5]|uniref:hypothetical protein n=1 Tax=Oceanirhabdus sp. W0125-5 TaxID=2999116 RepID=UPI0022F34364|nr:hypothetical protein [Oceanirhabdus sp. W0125-5]WBW96527.1 hypothetical protein OW730_22965 [Oceanirhabdus sp. W0125-5]